MQDFKKIKISLNPKYKVFRIDLYEEDFHIQLIDELTEIFLWLQEHLEVSTVVLSQSFTKNLGLKNKDHWTHENLTQYMNKIKTLGNTILQLPQTLIANFGVGVGAFAVEIFSLADIKVIQKKGKVLFNHLQLGLTPSFNFLQDSYSKNFLRSALLASEVYSGEDFKKLGYCQKVVENNLEEVLLDYFQTILKQGFLERIQSKLFFYKYQEDLIQTSYDLEKQIIESLKITEDWSKKNFLSSMEVKKRVQLKVFQGGKH